MKHTVIIGNGIAGVSAAKHIRKNSDQKITLISAESKYFFARTALMYVYMGHLPFQDTQPYEDNFWIKNKLHLIQDYVTQIDAENQCITLQNKQEINFTSLIIASGSIPNRYGWKGQDLKGVQGLYSKQDLEQRETDTKGIRNAVVVGGGLIGIEMAEMLLSRGIKVDFLVRESHFWKHALPEEDSEFIMKTMAQHKGLTMHYEDEISEIFGDLTGHVQHLKTKKGKNLRCQFVGLAIGVSPNISFVTGKEIETEKGILVNRFLETSCPNIYAIGDCAQMREPLPNRASIEQVWYTGKIMGETVAQTIVGQKTAYQPGIWFNSAKFFEMEYQTYGTVSQQTTSEIEHFSWEGENLRMNFAFEKKTDLFLGVNTFGIRLRHQLFDAWIKEKKNIEFVLTNLRAANFDPEFFKSFESEILTKFNSTHSRNITLCKRVWWRKKLTKQV
jgi:NADH oxidase (H2O2-forming)